MALKSLFSSEKDEKRNDQLWSIGFVEGYIKGSLSDLIWNKGYRKRAHLFFFIIRIFDTPPNGQIKYRKSGDYITCSFRMSGIKNIIRHYTDK